MADTQDFILNHRVAGALTVAAGAQPIPIPMPVELYGVYAAVGTAPTGAAILVNVRKNGTSLFAGANRVTIAAGATFGSKVEAPGVTSGQNVIAASVPSAVALGTFNTGDVFTVDVEQIGSTVAGSDLGVSLFFIEK